MHPHGGSTTFGRGALQLWQKLCPVTFVSVLRPRHRAHRHSKCGVRDVSIAGFGLLHAKHFGLS